MERILELLTFTFMVYKIIVIDYEIRVKKCFFFFFEFLASCSIFLVRLSFRRCFCKSKAHFASFKNFQNIVTLLNSNTLCNYFISQWILNFKKVLQFSYSTPSIWSTSFVKISKFTFEKQLTPSSHNPVMCDRGAIMRHTMVVLAFKFYWCSWEETELNWP